MYIAPGQEQATPGPKIFFISINLLPICSFLASFLPLRAIFLFFPIQMHGHPSVMIYINFVELHSQMLHTKFQNHRPSGSEEEDF